MADQDWFDDEALWRELDVFLFSEERLHSAASEVEALLSLAPPVNRRVLDLCCGPGRHALELARRGLDVTGVDRTGFLLDRARQLAADEGLHIEWVREDARHFARPDTFGLTLNMFTSFGYFEDPGDDLRVLVNVHASLVAGGVLLMDLAGKETVAAAIQDTQCWEAPDGALLVRRHHVVDDWTRVDNHWIVVRGDLARHVRFFTRLYSGEELRRLLEQAGFADVRLFGGLDGREYGLDAERLIAVAWKEDGAQE